MNISFKWLKNYIDLDLTAEETARILTDIGLEVESFEKVETIRGGLKEVVVAEVLTCEEHPDSDHLHVTTVNTGEGEPLQIVCGAPNCRAGLKVICAKVGAVLYPTGSDEEFKIKRSKIRGVESLGMLCAEDEIGIGTAHAGIIELPDDAVPGTPAAQYYNISDDYLIGIGLTPNRIDAASHIGVARDLAAYLTANGKKCSVKLPDVSSFSTVPGKSVKVIVENTEACPRYTGVSVRGCRIAPSPEWMQNELRAAGINPKNNLVDITNYVLFELGQPLHAFDEEKIDQATVIVRNCKEGTPFVTLDGVERKLNAQDLMICSATKPMCIAGVFGGLDSGVSETTKDVFIESAYFNPVSVRKTAKRFGLNTDASFRFERGIDPNIQVYALKRAAILFRDLAGGTITGDIVESSSETVPPFEVEFSLERSKKLIGKEIPDTTIRTILAALEIEILEEKDGILRLGVPPYRVDVQREADVIEDILRIYGYNNVEIPSHVNSTLSYIQKPDRTKMVNLVSDALTARGYTEIMSNSLTKSAYYENLTSYPLGKCVRILNPLSADLNVMRQTLLFNALEAVALNINHRNSDLKLYEFGSCYTKTEPQEGQEDRLAAYRETFRMSATVTGNYQRQSWNSKAEQSSFFSLRKAVELLLRRFGLEPVSLKVESLASDLFSSALELFINNKPLVQMGQVSPAVCKTFDIKQPVYYAEINFDLLMKATKKHKVTVTELPKFPEVRRDLSMMVDCQVTFSQLHSIAFATERKLLKKVELFDVYEGDKLPAGKKSYALTFILEDKEQTMNDKTIDRIMENLQKAFEKEAGAQLR